MRLEPREQAPRWRSMVLAPLGAFAASLLFAALLVLWSGAVPSAPSVWCSRAPPVRNSRCWRR